MNIEQHEIYLPKYASMMLLYPTLFENNDFTKRRATIGSHIT